MAKRGLSDQLDAAVEALMAAPDDPLTSIDPRLDELLRIAADLRDLPRSDFKEHLKADLQRRAASAGSGTTTSTHQSTATPYLLVREAGRAIDFYKRAFGAADRMPPLTDATGKIMHAEIEIGGSRIMLADEAPEWGNHSPQSLGGTPVIIALQVDDVDALAEQAVHAGAEVLIPVADQFYGERSGRLRDPFGHIWIVSTHKEDVSPEEMQQRATAMMEEFERAASTREELYVVEPFV
ncbi:MAG TPA: VOC family protein, partial [Candidatus Acidoferrales bacterium]|nr:VOC family protein [Candidatus Acidoferrales bacterium]